MNASETAVVLIEFQNDFCKEGGKLFDLVKEELARQGTIPHAVKLAEQARKKGCLVIHCPFVYDEKWAGDCQVCGIIAEAGANDAFQPGAWGAKLIDELQPAESDEVLAGKRALSGFTNTELEELLKQRGVKNVVLAGFLSNVCVEATARSAYDRGFRVQVIRDATAATSKENQEYVEREIYPILGGSITVDEFLAQLD